MTNVGLNPIMLPAQQRVREVISAGSASIYNSVVAALALGLKYCRSARLMDCSVTRHHLVTLARKALTTAERYLQAELFENCSDALETAERLRYEIGQLVPHVVQDKPNEYTTPQRQQLYAAIVESSEDAIITKDLKLPPAGERGGRLWADGKTDAAIRLEQIFNELAEIHDMDILCAYPLTHAEEYKSAFANLCAEHTQASFRWSRSADNG